MQTILQSILASTGCISHGLTLHYGIPPEYSNVLEVVAQDR